MDTPTAQPVLDKYCQFQKVADVAQNDGSMMHVMYGIMTSQKPDSENEIAVFADISEEIRKWSQAAFDSTTSAGQESSLGNLRVQHNMNLVAGKVIGIDFNTDKMEIRAKSTPKDEAIWSEVLRGIWRGYSIAGRYKFRICSQCKSDIKKAGNYCEVCKTSDNPVLYSAEISELSIVDSPSLPEAVFEYVKANNTFQYQRLDGSCEIRKFCAALSVPVAALPDPVPEPAKSVEPVEVIPPVITAPQEVPVKAAKAKPVIKEAKTKRKAGEDLPASAFLIVEDPNDTSTWKLPVKFSTEEKSKRHVQNALARFSATEAPAELKAKAWKKLLRLCKKYGIEVSDDKKPADKAASPNADEAKKEITAQFFKGVVEKVGDRIGMKKGMYEVAWLASLIQDVASLQLNTTWERDYEGDGSDLPDELHAILEDLIETFLHMAEEETSELSETVAA